MDVNFLLEHMGYKKNLEFFVDFKNLNLPLCKDTPKKVISKKLKNVAKIQFLWNSFFR